ncbi:MAG: hypothetical protein OEY38_14765 [Gammaproteobacteria bacterium]|nr:hypothetical protein [Gammaproteobacteria bacterium]
MKQRKDGKFSTLHDLAKVVGLRFQLVRDDDTVDAIQRGAFFE